MHKIGCLPVKGQCISIIMNRWAVSVFIYLWLQGERWASCIDIIESHVDIILLHIQDGLSRKLFHCLLSGSVDLK
jgi:hypothetical protein